MTKIYSRRNKKPNGPYIYLKIEIGFKNLTQKTWCADGFIGEFYQTFKEVKNLNSLKYWKGENIFQPILWAQITLIPN